MRRSILIGLAIAAPSLVAAGSATAATTVVRVANTDQNFGLTAFSVPDETGPQYAGVTVIETARGNNLGNPPSSTTTNLGIECGAVSTGAAATGIVECYAQGLFSGEIYRIPSTGAKPGATDARASVGINLPMEPFKVCMRTNVLLRDESTTYATPLSCSVT